MKQKRRLSKVEKSQNLDTKSEVSTKISSLVEASFAKRIASSSIDFLLAVFIWFTLLMLVMSPIANSTMNYSKKMSLGLNYQIATHLYVYQQQEENGDITTIEVKDFSTKINTSLSSDVISLTKLTDFKPSYYLEHLRYYYRSFLTGENIELPADTSTKKYDKDEDHYVSSDYKEYVKDTNLLPSDYYTERYFNESILKIESDGASYFVATSLSDVASIKEGIDESAANKYLLEKIASASTDFYNRGYFVSLNNELKAIQLFMVLIPYIFVMCFFYLLFPLILKNGETLGKRFMHLAIIDKNGYIAKKRQIIFRFFVFLFELSLSLFVIGVGTTSFVTLGVGLTILMVFTLANKDKRAPHDYAAHTLVIDADKSVFFKDAIEEKKAEDELKEKLEKYKSQKVENKNVIQVGNTIVNEKIKQEFLEAQEKEKGENK